MSNLASNYAKRRSHGAVLLVLLCLIVLPRPKFATAEEAAISRIVASPMMSLSGSQHSMNALDPFYAEIQQGNGSIRVLWDASLSSQYLYMVQSIGDLQEAVWTNRFMAFGASGISSWQEGMPDGDLCRFYRVTRLLATDDSDGDGMPNGWEGQYWPSLDPLINDALQDPDGDGINNLAEYQQGGNPTADDTIAVTNTDASLFLACTHGAGNILFDPSMTRLSLSVDGTNWFPFGSGPILTNATYGLGDPSMIFWSNQWVMVTDPRHPGAAPTSHTFYVHTARDDLNVWTEKYVYNAGYGTNLWAPELFIEPSDGSLHVYFSMSTNYTAGLDHKLFETHAMDGTLTNWSAPVMVTGSAYTNNEYCIDPYMVKLGSTYYLWSKRNNLPSYATSTSPVSGFVQSDTAKFANLYGHEAPCLVNLGGDHWRIYVDQNSTEFSEVTTGFGATWPAPQLCNVPRYMGHATVVRLTNFRQAFDALATFARAENINERFSLVCQYGITNGTQVISNNTATSIQYGYAPIDTIGETYNTWPYNNPFTNRLAGIYEMDASVTFRGDGYTCDWATQWYTNGVLAFERREFGAGSNRTVEARTVLRLPAGTEVVSKAYHNAGVPISIGVSGRDQRIILRIR